MSEDRINRIVCTALLHRVVVGNVSKDGFTLTKKVDRTNDFLQACIDYLKANNTEVRLDVKGKPKYLITLKELESEGDLQNSNNVKEK